MPRNSNEPKFTQEEMAQALIEAGGVVLGAAIRLRCSTKTVHRYVAKYKKVAEANRRISGAKTVLLELGKGVVEEGTDAS